MRILVPTSSFPKDEDDGAGRFVLDLSRALARRGHQLCHLVPDHLGRDLRSEIAPDLTLRRIPFRPRFCRGLVMGAGIGANLKAAPWRILGLPGLMSALRRGLAEEHKRFQATHILSHWILPAGLAAGTLARREQLPHVTVVHGGALQNLLAIPGLGRVLKTWAQGSTAALYVSEELRAKARARLQNLSPPDAVSAMGVDCARFGPQLGQAEARESLGLPAHQTIFLGVGRLLPLKGFDLLIRALAGLENCHLVLAGVGPELRSLQELAAGLRVSLRCVGYLGPRDLARYMDAADRLVIPSRLGFGGRSEGSPVVAMEALARGLGVIGSASGGLPDLLRGRPCCELFPVDDGQALQSLLRALVHQTGPMAALPRSVVSEGELWDYNRIALIVESLLGVQGGSS